jgi:RNA polymerase-associated protein CTR9
MDDVEMQIEVACLWQGENLERMGKALKEALRVSQASGESNPRLVNNIAVLHHLEGNLIEARAMYESALTSVTTLPVDNAEALSTTVLYNLARVYEDQGDENFARDAYDKLLSRHPEYVDGVFWLISNPTTNNSESHFRQPKFDLHICSRA